MTKMNHIGFFFLHKTYWLLSCIIIKQRGAPAPLPPPPPYPKKLIFFFLKGLVSAGDNKCQLTVRLVYTPCLNILTLARQSQFGQNVNRRLRCSFWKNVPFNWLMYLNHQVERLDGIPKNNQCRMQPLNYACNNSVDIQNQHAVQFNLLEFSTSNINLTSNY